VGAQEVMMGFAMLLALPAMLLMGTLLDVMTADDSAATESEDTADVTGHGDLMNEEDANG
jgi:hypothetical protein